ncbi:MAG: response regulator [Syntrophobacteraceae bacterium]
MRVLLADDHPLFLDGLKNLLTIRGIEVIGTASDGIEALEKARTLKPEVILMDIQMPRLDGLAAARTLKAEQPDIKIVILTMSEKDEDLFEAIKSGACGYILKAEETDHFFEILSGLIRGEVPLSSGLAGRVLKEFVRQGEEIRKVERQAGKEEALTPRQMEVLSIVAQGLTYKEIGAKLFLTEHTIKYHMGQIIERLQLENRRQAVEYARRMERPQTSPSTDVSYIAKV